MVPQVETIRARARWQPHSADELFIRSESGVAWSRWRKGGGSVTEPDNSSASEAARERLSSNSLSLPPNEIMSLATAEGHSSCWVKRTDECSLSVVMARHVDIEPAWARLSPAAQILCPAAFHSQVPGRKKRGGREELSVSVERQDWNSRNEGSQSSGGNHGISPSMTHTSAWVSSGETCTSYNDGTAFATTPWNLLFCEALWIDARWLQRMTELASWSLREVLIRLLAAFQQQIPASAKKGVFCWREEIWDAVSGNGLYRQTHLPFWRAMVGCIALAHSPPPCIGPFFILHEPIMCNYNCVIEIGFSWRGNEFFPY